jgi:MFS transporter, DHA1 family, inner membrane transport protein
MDRRLLVLALGMFALGTDNFVVAGVLPEIARGFHIGIGAAGQLTTVYALSFALLAPTVAALAANVPRKRLLVTGLGIFVIANLGTAVAPGFAIALATRALAGLGAAIFSPTAVGAATVIVPPERTGSALAVVVAGITISTALGSPLGTVIGGLGDWRWTMVFVATLAAISCLGLFAFLSEIPMLPSISLSRRLAPIADARVGLTLATAFLFFCGSLTIYTYFAVVFERAIRNNSFVFGGLLVTWGVAGMLTNLPAGRMIDKLGNHRVLTFMLAFVLADFALLAWTGSNFWTAIAAIVIWGACSWGTVVPLQHRLVHIGPSIAPILLGLNNSAIYFGTAAAGIIGAAGIKILGGRYLGDIGATFVAASMIVSELSARRIATVHPTNTSGEGSMTLGPTNKGSYAVTKSLCFVIVALIGLSAAGCSAGPHYQPHVVMLGPYVNAPRTTSQDKLSPPPTHSFADGELTKLVDRVPAQNLDLAVSVYPSRSSERSLELSLNTRQGNKVELR